jgi:transcription initiation protein SPT3
MAMNSDSELSDGELFSPIINSEASIVVAPVLHGPQNSQECTPNLDPGTQESRNSKIFTVPAEQPRSILDQYAISARNRQSEHWTNKIIRQMMFVSGETGEPSSETTILVEAIIQQQVKELLRRAVELANRRGNRTITPDELMFLYRGDKGKLNRLLHFLQWKDVRKNLNEQEGGGGADADLAVGEEAAVVAGPGGGAAVDPKKTAKKAKVQLLWDVSSFFSETVPPREDEDDEEEREMNVATLERLKYADERTRNMTKEDYMHWSECRQASFTYRKGKRFREWVGMDTIVSSKPSDDVLDILGFLTFEMVQTLTEEALKVKTEEDLFKKASGSTENGDGNTRKRKREPGLFDGPEEEREPVMPPHIQEGFRRLQRPNAKQIYGAKITGRPPPSALKLF